MAEKPKTRLFSVSNKHVADSGTPPHFDGDTEDRYYGYFQNAYGERAVFVYDHATQTGTPRTGDAGNLARSPMAWRAISCWMRLNRFG